MLPECDTGAARMWYERVNGIESTRFTGDTAMKTNRQEIRQPAALFLSSVSRLALLASFLSAGPVLGQSELLFTRTIVTSEGAI